MNWRSATIPPAGRRFFIAVLRRWDESARASGLSRLARRNRAGDVAICAQFAHREGSAQPGRGDIAAPGNGSADGAKLNSGRRSPRNMTGEASLFLCLPCCMEDDMSDLNNQEYYRARARASRQLEQAASNPHIAKIHAEFARHYEAALAGDDTALLVAEELRPPVAGGYGDTSRRTRPLSPALAGRGWSAFRG